MQHPRAGVSPESPDSGRLCRGPSADLWRPRIGVYGTGRNFSQCAPRQCDEVPSEGVRKSTRNRSHDQCASIGGDLAPKSPRCVLANPSATKALLARGLAHPRLSGQIASGALRLKDAGTTVNDNVGDANACIYNYGCVIVFEKWEAELKSFVSCLPAAPPAMTGASQETTARPCAPRRKPCSWFHRQTFGSNIEHQ